MSPILKFESAACQIYSSRAHPVDKAKRLLEISSAIEAYIARAPVPKEMQLDRWQIALVSRSLEYLRLLQRDIRILASEHAGEEKPRVNVKPEPTLAKQPG